MWVLFSGRGADTYCYRYAAKDRARGPDAHGLYTDGEIQRSSDISDLESRENARVCLGHSELSIVRGETGVIQPLRSCNGSLSLVHNGEIYNCQELRSLLGKGYVSYRSRTLLSVKKVSEMAKEVLIRKRKKAK